MDPGPQPNEINPVIARILSQIQKQLLAQDGVTLIISDSAQAFTLIDPKLKAGKFEDDITRVGALLPRAALPWAMSVEKDRKFRLFFAGIELLEPTSEEICRRLDDLVMFDRLFERHAEDQCSSYAFCYDEMQPDGDRVATIWGVTPPEASLKLLLSLNPKTAESFSLMMSANPHIAGKMLMFRTKDHATIELDDVLLEARNLLHQASPDG